MRELIVVTESGCWEWTGTIDPKGYGRFKAARAGSTNLVHRIVHAAAHGPTPSATPLDHECHNPEVCRAGDSCPHRRCCNPNEGHVVRSTTSANCQRTSKTAQEACIHGHLFTEDSTIWTRSGHRRCRTCENGRAPAAQQRREARFHAGELTVVHGKRSTYNAGCRCQECRDVSAEYQRQRLARKHTAPAVEVAR